MDPGRDAPLFPGALPIRIEHAEAGAVVWVSGALDADTSPQLGRCLTGLLDHGAHHLEVELGSVPFCDSSGLGVLVGAHRRLSDQGSRLEVAHPRDEVRHLLAISGLDRVFLVR